MDESFFKTARPVWLTGREMEQNLLVGFHAEFAWNGEIPVFIRVAASTIYRLFCNGHHAGYGPARAAHGYFRVDEWALTEYLEKGKNHIAIEVTGYNVPCYAYIVQPSFLQAEVFTGNGSTLASTNGSGTCFGAANLSHRVQTFERYSEQRAFVEIYNLTPDYSQWREKGFSGHSAPENVSEKKFLRRRVSYPAFDIIYPSMIVREGEVQSICPSESDNSPTPLLNQVKKLNMLNKRNVSVADSNAQDVLIGTSQFRIWEFERNYCGFIGLKVRCAGRTRLLLFFDELTIEDDVSYMRQVALNAVSCEFAETGTYRFETSEPYIMKYLKIIVLQGECRFEKIYLRELANPDGDHVHLNSHDEELNLIFEASRQSFRQNALDIFMDCPGRERAGWIGDSYYTAKAAAGLTGKIDIETNQFENYLLPETFPGISDGVLPMCYPAENPGKRYIPTFCFWFIMQLEDYRKRGGEKWLIESLRKRILGVIKYFEKFKNELGLLENLESWVFIEWSRAAEFIKDVNIPANLLYLMALEATARLYGIESFATEAAQLRKTINKNAFDGHFFMDNLVRSKSKLIPTSNHTEICQYLAFAANVATPESHPRLWQIILDIDKFPQPDLCSRNLLFGGCLRLELLDRFGLTGQLLTEIKTSFLSMAICTGTLWEHYDSTVSSCNHGFTAYIADLLLRHKDG